MNTKALPFVLGSFFALTAVVLGAFGAHALKGLLEPGQLISYETGVRYQMYHAFALFIGGIKQHILPAKSDKAFTFLMTAGIVFFSFSIYILSTSPVTGLQWKWLGPVTPIGGMLLIIGWALLLADAIRLLGKKGV